MGDPDTSLAIFLWNDATRNFGESIEEYTRLYVEKDTILSLMHILFGQCPDFKRKMDDIQSAQKSFRNFVANEVVKEWKEHGKLSESMELNFLEISKDPILDTISGAYKTQTK